MEAVIKMKILTENINKNDIETKNLLKRIIDCDSDIIELNKLNLSITKKMTEAKQYLSEFHTLQRRFDDDEDSARYQSQYESMQNQLDMNATLMRKSVHDAQRRINENSRAMLFSSTTQLRNRFNNTTPDGNEATEEIAATQASNLTDDLKALNRMLSMEVEKSNSNLSTLVSSSELVTENSEEFKVMSNYITNSKTLLEKYGRRGFTDKLLVWFAFILYCGCLIYVIVKRI